LAKWVRAKMNKTDGKISETKVPLKFKNKGTSLSDIFGSKQN
jgi:hypothetical protein